MICPSSSRAGGDWRDEEIFPGDLVERAKAASLSLFQNDAVELVIAVEDDLPSFRGDPDRLLQVLINLISNAAKFTEKGSVTCGVQLRDNTLLFSVADTGLGVPESQQKIIFSKFSQVQTQKSGKPSGTGLGLPISREIVTHHNGIIWVESEFGNGSTFYFTLPLA